MRDEKRSDQIVSGILIAFPVLALILGLIPGFLPMYSQETASYVGCCLLNPPAGNVMTNLCPLLLIVFVYSLILTICYYRSQALGTIKAIFIFSVVCLAVSLLAFLPRQTVQVMPYALIPGLWGIMCIVSFIRMQLEIKRYDFD